jgi:protease II
VEKFWLVQPMQAGVRYQVKHSGEFLYKMSNEGTDGNFKITKIRVPEKVRLLAEEETLALPEDQMVKSQEDQLQFSRLGKREYAPVSKHLNKRDNSVFGVLPSPTTSDAETKSADELGAALVSVP